MTVVTNNCGVASAHFKRDHPSRAIEVGGKNASTCDPRSSKKNAVDIWMIAQFRCNLRATRNHIEDSRRKGSKIGEFCQKLTNRRRTFAWLENDCISSQKCRNEMTVGQVSGEIEWPKDCHHAMGPKCANSSARLSDCKVKTCNTARALHLKRDRNFIRKRFCFKTTLGKSLASFERDQSSHSIFVRSEHISPSHQCCAAKILACIDPPPPCCSSSLYGEINMRMLCCTRPDFDSRMRRVVACNKFR